MSLPYKIRFLELNSRDIYNYVGPWDWRDSIIRQQKRQFIYDDKPEWYNNLENDILLNGFNNPILAVSGQLPKNNWSIIPTYAKKGAICNILGGSRLFVAQKHNLTIPVILSDFNNHYSGLGQEIFHSTDILNLFTQPPSRIIYSKWGLDLRDLPGNNDK